MASVATSVKAEQLAKCTQALASGQWQQILDWGADDSFLLQRHLMLNAYIAAAHELEDKEALTRAADLATATRWAIPHRFSFSRSLIAARRCDLAWKVMRAEPDTISDPKFVKHAKAVMSYSDDTDLRKEVLREIRVATSGGAEIRPAVSVRAFPAPSSKRRKLGSTSAVSSSRTPERHQAAFDHYLSKCGKRLAKSARPALFEYSNVFLDRHGQIWTEEGAIVKTVGQKIQSVTRDSVVQYDEAIHCVKPTRGIYHWLIDRVCHLSWLVGNESGAPQILLSDAAQGFEIETLKLLDLDGLISKVSDPVFVRKLIFPRVGFEGLTFWDQVSPIFDKLKDVSAKIAEQHSVVAMDRIYISRSDAKRRPLSNEKEIEAALARDGYKVVSFTGMPLWWQFFIASSAREIVAPHGAGLSHLIMCRPGTKVTEIVPITDGTHALRFNYARLSIALGLTYRAWIEPQLGEADSWSVDIEPFLKFLRAP